MMRRLLIATFAAEILLWLLTASALYAEPGTLTSVLNLTEVKQHVEALSLLGSRFTGYPGYYASLAYINSSLVSSGLKPRFLAFNATVPIDYGATIKVGASVIRAYHMYPNLVALGAATNVSGQLVYAGHCTPPELAGLDLRGKIAVLEFDADWGAAIARGARALIFLGPAVDRDSAMRKVALAPLDIPRVYVREGADADFVREASRKGLYATIEGRYEWKRVTAYNILVEIAGSSEPEKIVILTAHVDSGSIVPALAPGAEEAVNVGLLLHLARLLSEYRPKYTVWLLFLSGHWQGLAGARWFVEKIMFSELIGSSVYPYIVLNFDISSGDSRLVVYPGGFFYGHRTQGAMNLYTDFRSSLAEIIKDFYQKYPSDYRAIASDAMYYNATTGIVFLRSFNPGYAISYSQPFYLDAEPFQLAKVPAVTFLTFQDKRPRVFTPADTYDHINWENIKPQVRFAAFVLDKILNDVTLVFRGSWDTIKPRRIEVDPVNGGFGYHVAIVEVVEYDPTVATLYRPVPNSLVVVHKRDWYFNVMGSLAVTQYDPPFAKIIELADENGKATIVGLAPPEIFIGNIEVYAYKVEGGRLTYVPDMGPNGLARFSPYPPKLSMGIVLRTVVFRAAALIAPLVSVPDRPWPLATFNLYGKASFPIPFTRYTSPYPSAVSIFYPNLATPDSYYYTIDFSNRFVILYAPPESRICAIVSLGGDQRRAIVLLNSTTEGIMNGYRLGRAGSTEVITNTPYIYTLELLAIAKDRYSKAVSGGVSDPTTVELLKMVENYTAKKEFGFAWAAWSAALRLYERTRGMSLDFASATLIVMLLIVPFAVLGEKLFFGRGGIVRIAYIVTLGAVMFSVFALLHPGFTIVYSTYALSISVIMAALSIPALFFLIILFNRSLSQVRRIRLGVHALERETFDLFVTAMSTGIENMRRRPLRTALTLSTIILVVMSLVALTSVVPVLRITASTYETHATFDGIVVKSPSNEPLDPLLLDVLEDFAKGRYVVAPRYWLYPPLIEDYFTLSSGGRSVVFRAVMGLAPAELNASLKELGLSQTIFSRVASSCLLPKTLASALGVDVGDTVRFAGEELIVAGVFDDSLAEMLARDVTDRVGERPYGGRPYDLVTVATMQRIDESYRLSWSDIIVINAELVKNLPGALLHSVLLMPKGRVSEEELVSTAMEIYNVFSGLDVYVSYGGRTHIISGRFVHEFFGFSFMVVPLLISGMVLMTTVLGSIHERLREATTYSALGLAPAQVGGMFLAEVLTYAILGVALGYAAGVVMARATNFAALTGGIIGMNYSSSSVLVGLALAILMVLLASLYPFLKVSRIVTPSLERKWKIPTKPRGDVWEIPLPFTFKEREMVVGVTIYLCEYFENRRERMGTFAVLSYAPYSEPGRVGVRAKVWLAPFEQNIVQDVDVALLKSATEARYMTLVTAKRESGPHDTWLKSCDLFVRELREQFLTWRLLSPQERATYIKRGVELVKIYE